MRVSLIDVDGKIPNLALMKISSYHKKMGDVVGLNLPNPDKVYMSIIFSKNKGKSLNSSLVEGVEYVYGGSGFDLNKSLPLEIEFLKPDYTLYPSTYSQGFTTRGCIRNCYFCYVPAKEGRLVRHQHPRDFHDPSFDTINIMDNNWLADRDWFFETSNWIIHKKLKVIENGFDIRLIDDEVIEQIKMLRIKLWHFAFDFSDLEKVVREKVQVLKDHDVCPKNKCDFYVYCDSDESFDDALYRVNVLRSIGASAFVMYNCTRPKTRRIRDLVRWCNRKCLYWTVPFEKYSRLCHT